MTDGGDVRSYDLAILGVGAVGSGALLHAATMGLNVIGFERFQPGHHHGSSHGETRLIRKAYFEAPAYVPLIERAYTKWRALEARVGRQLLCTSGIVEVGPEHGEVVSGVLHSANRHGLEIERLSSLEVERRFPGLRIPDGMVAVYETEGGYLHVEEAVKAQCAVATCDGATLMNDVVVQCIERTEPDLTIHTSHGPLRAARVLCTLGAWAPEFLRDVGVSLRVKRKVLAWLALNPQDASLYQAPSGVSFLYEMPGTVVYGFPSLDGKTLKVASHDDGVFIPGPEGLDRRVHAEDLHAVQAFANAYLPGVDADRLVRHEVCMYTMSNDLHMIVDHDPEDPRVWYAAGLSGHGFKYSNALGEALVQLSVEGESEVDLSSFSAARFR